MYQNRGVCLVSTMPAILSVTVPKGCPGPMTAAGVIVSSLMSIVSCGNFDIRLGPLQFGIQILDRAQVSRARLGAEFGQQLVVALLRLEFGDAAVGVVHVAEDDGLRRARLGAGSLNLAIAHPSPLALAIDLGALDALYAVGAFLHHAATADRDFGVAQQLQRLCVEILVEQEVEAPHLVRAVVRAVARADAAVINHVVETFGAMHRRADRADDFARRLLALLTWQRLIVSLRVRFVAAVVAVNPQPVHLAAAHHLLFADHRDVVFGVAGDDAGRTADAGVNVNRHAPAIALRVFVFGIKRRTLAFERLLAALVSGLLGFV